MEKTIKDITIDDMIVEYMMYKVRNGYEPSYTIKEFMDFINKFEERVEVKGTIPDGKKLFYDFFDRKSERHWSSVNFTTGKKVFDPHMVMDYLEEDDDYLISCTYKLSDYDGSVLNTYFMDRDELAYIRSLIRMYLSNQTKRNIDIYTECSRDEVAVAKYVSASIIEEIWQAHIERLIEKRTWPSQCRDINKYLFDTDLASVIGVSSIKTSLLEYYNVMYKRIATLLHNDKCLEISSAFNAYLARANYDLIIEGYEKLMGYAYGPYRKKLDLDFNSSYFKENHKVYNSEFDDDPDFQTEEYSYDAVKKIVKNMEEESRNRFRG